MFLVLFAVVMLMLAVAGQLASKDAFKNLENLIQWGLWLRRNRTIASALPFFQPLTVLLCCLQCVASLVLAVYTHDS